MIPFLSKSNQNLTNIQTILDQIEKPCLLWDKGHDKILQINKQWEILTSYNFVDLGNVNIRNIILNCDLNQIISEKNKCLVNTKNGTKIECGLRVFRLEDFLFLIVINLANGTIQKISEPNEIVEIINNFLNLNNEVELQELAECILNMIGQIFEYADSAFYYGEDSQKYFMVAHSHKTVNLPIAINFDEINFNHSITLWKSGDRALNEIQRIAKQSNCSFLIQINLCFRNKAKALLVLLFKNKIINQSDIVLFPALVAIIQAKISGFMEAKTQLIVANESIFENSILKKMIENVQNGILIVDKDKIIKQCNKAAQTIIGFDVWEMIGEPIQRIVPTLESILRPNIEEAISKNFTIELSRRDGKKVYSSISIYKLEVPIAQKINNEYFEIIIEDISELRTLQVEKSQLLRQAEMGIMVASFAHDVRNVFNSILLNAEAAQMSFPESKELTEKMMIIKDECENINQLMESVLSYSSSFERNKQAIDVFFMLERLLERWKPKLQRLNIKSILQTEQVIPQIMGDPRSLEQVFNNLISNAKDAMTSNGGMLGIYISQLKNENVVEIKISDSGAGIPEELINKIFDPYFSTRPGGTGLGLAITKKIVEIHHGDIMVESFPGGTTFKIHLPVIKNGAGE